VDLFRIVHFSAGGRPVRRCRPGRSRASTTASATRSASVAEPADADVGDRPPLRGARRRRGVTRLGSVSWTAGRAAARPTRRSPTRGRFSVPRSRPRPSAGSSSGSHRPRAQPVYFPIRGPGKWAPDYSTTLVFEQNSTWKFHVEIPVAPLGAGRADGHLRGLRAEGLGPLHEPRPEPELRGEYHRNWNSQPHGGFTASSITRDTSWASHVSRSGATQCNKRNHGYCQVVQLVAPTGSRQRRT
jgi:hypothetical protein